MKHPLLLRTVILLISSTYLQGITFDISLANLAEIDIVISKNAMLPESMASEFFNTTSRVIAGYSFLLNSDNTISLWQRLYSGTALNTFLLPANRLILPLQQNNPFFIELTLEQIQKITEEEASQVWVRIRQRTYEWNSEINGLQFFEYNVLADNIYPVNASICLNASGVVAPEKLDTIPIALRNTYTVACGSVS